ncbi:ABC-type dipeptide/oligopeptide/nickel transport system permease component [Friedmanniella endophytica]|uniref:ABC-type dipeptide/oligopeptide/nickel transport system permease component n=1 Tax=Microlunatus kandeliicorticis TaxID=1759536 RepID=A0A7W3IS46_9ACTN|nr:ABC transporter permease [Microlunatus kandeliicorticis]MBA8794193.1 ABC-type dipeptide/oligopeptide/nickel transport system permease component [Microlunatus kandeliicorticis]
MITGRTALRVGQRLLGLVVVFLGVTFVIYLMVFSLPGDPIRALGGDRPLTETVIANLRAEYHLDEPVGEQYLRFLGGLLHGDLGTSFTGRSVTEQLRERWPVTIVLALTAWVFEIVLGVGLGILAALRRGTVIDKGVLAATIVLSAIPVFVLGSVAQLVFGVRLGWFPVAGSREGWPISFILPGLVIAVFGLASVSRLTRGSMLEGLGADYVRTARSLGVPPRRVVGVHVLRNSLIPTVTYLGTDLGYLLGGTVIVEGIFNLPGVGNLLVTSIRAHEGPTVVGISTALIVIFLLTSLLVDLAHGLLDPRIRRG